MKVREHLNRRIIPVFGVILLCFILIAVVMTVARSQLLLVPLLVGFVVCILFLQYGIRAKDVTILLRSLFIYAAADTFGSRRKSVFARSAAWISIWT
jgi:hypothetical protein